MEDNNNLVCGKSGTMECDALAEDEHPSYEEEEEVMVDEIDVENFDP